MLICVHPVSVLSWIGSRYNFGAKLHRACSLERRQRSQIRTSSSLSKLIRCSTAVSIWPGHKVRGLLNILRDMTSWHKLNLLLRLAARWFDLSFYISNKYPISLLLLIPNHVTQLTVKITVIHGHSEAKPSHYHDWIFFWEMTWNIRRELNLPVKQTRCVLIICLVNVLFYIVRWI